MWSAATARAASCVTSIGRELHGDSANHAWGVMDVLAVTDFPDIRCKSLIQSAHEGSIIVIPREGGYLFRLYVELTKLDSGERVAAVTSPPMRWSRRRDAFSIRTSST